MEKNEWCRFNLLKRSITGIRIDVGQRCLKAKVCVKVWNTPLRRQSSFHPCNKLRVVTLNFRSVPLDCCISCLLQNFRQAPMANCIIVNRSEWWGTCICDWIPVVLNHGYWAVLCLYLGLGHVKHPHTSLFLSRLSASDVNVDEKTPVRSVGRFCCSYLHDIWLYKRHQQVQAQYSLKVLFMILMI